MKGVENIVEKIMADAKIAAAEIESAAKAEAEAILKSTEETASATVAAMLDRADGESKDILRRADSTMNLEGRKAILAERQKLIEEAFEAAEKRLFALMANEDSYCNTLTVLARDAGEDSVLLIANEDIAVGKKLSEATKLTVEGAKIARGGIVVKQGEVEVNLTFTALLRQYREELEQSVATTLFA